MYKDINEYGVIGDMHSVALVSRDGSIDYCSMPHIDSPTVFAGLLDNENGGYFRIQPQDDFEVEQGYIGDTNILRSLFTTKSGQAELIDFMPAGKEEMFEKGEHSIHRCLKVVKGRVEFTLECIPRPNYASIMPIIQRKENTFLIRVKNEVFTFTVDAENYDVVEDEKNEITIYIVLNKGEAAHFEFIYGDKEQDSKRPCPVERTARFWYEWVSNCIAGKCTFLGEYAPLINRSLLALKLLTFQPTGAIAAAATTSLPEAIGGVRNWDYRFSWIRDASFTLKALFSLGYVAEADSFIRWLHTTYQKHGSQKLQIMYSLEGDNLLFEKELLHLRGYKDSKPVRTGNAAFKQSQWDIYGEIMDTALRLSDYVGKIDGALWPFFRDICNLALNNWHEPDDGIWEVRSGPFHFVYSKVMCWVALDRGIKIASRYGFDAPLKKWERERDRIKEDVLKKGYDKNLQSFVQHYGSQEADASLLLLPLLGFLPISDDKIQGTIEYCKKRLLQNGFLMRYSGKDGLQGKEGDFVLCNFWLIECFVRSGKLEDAKGLLRTTMKAANHLGLFAEEYNSGTGEMLGNFPQAFSHIGLINAVTAILSAEAKKVEKEHRESWRGRLEKLMPTKVMLNRADAESGEAGQVIAKELKISLNNLQGAFFDTVEGRVNYRAMKESKSYRDYTELAKKLNFFDPFTLKNDEEKKAFWVNVYNILIIHGVIELDIYTSVKEIFNFFGRVGYRIGGMFFSPDDIEHGILRLNNIRPGSRLKQFSVLDERKALCLEKPDPRVHFALVCASSSCPPVEFFDPENIENQLDIAAKSFINRKGLIIDRTNMVIRLSQVFKWYGADFGKNRNDILNFISGLSDKKTSTFIQEKRDSLRIQYLPYNWNLNNTLESSSISVSRGV
jgi:GH15 family glucan-1,4-alpha-glucosidase